MLAAELGASAIGFVFWPGSPRFIDPYRARRIAAALPLWVAAVYFDGPDQEKATNLALHALPEDVPDAAFVSLRKSGEGWPLAQQIR